MYSERGNTLSFVKCKYLLNMSFLIFSNFGQILCTKERKDKKTTSKGDPLSYNPAAMVDFANKGCITVLIG